MSAYESGQTVFLKLTARQRAGHVILLKMNTQIEFVAGNTHNLVNSACRHDRDNLSCFCRPCRFPHSPKIPS